MDFDEEAWVTQISNRSSFNPSETHSTSSFQSTFPQDSSQNSSAARKRFYNELDLKEKVGWNDPLNHLSTIPSRSQTKFDDGLVYTFSIETSSQPSDTTGPPALIVPSRPLISTRYTSQTVVDSQSELHPFLQWEGVLQSVSTPSDLEINPPNTSSGNDTPANFAVQTGIDDDFDMFSTTEYTNVPVVPHLTPQETQPASQTTSAPDHTPPPPPKVETEDEFRERLRQEMQELTSLGRDESYMAEGDDMDVDDNAFQHAINPSLLLEMQADKPTHRSKISKAKGGPSQAKMEKKMNKEWNEVQEYWKQQKNTGGLMGLEGRSFNGSDAG